MVRVVDTSAGVAADDGHERHHLTGIATEVVGEGQRTVVAELPFRGGLAPELQPAFEHHPEPRCADRLPRGRCPIWPVG